MSWIAHIHYLHKNDYELQILSGSCLTYKSVVDFVITQLQLYFIKQLDGFLRPPEADYIFDLQKLSTQEEFNEWIEKAFGKKDFMKVVIERTFSEIWSIPKMTRTPVERSQLTEMKETIQNLTVALDHMETGFYDTVD